jgi:hypothetical protein
MQLIKYRYIGLDQKPGRNKSRNKEREREREIESGRVACLYVFVTLRVI